MPGFTAYGGLRVIGKPQPRETVVVAAASGPVGSLVGQLGQLAGARAVDRKSTRLNSSHGYISYAVFCLKKKKKTEKSKTKRCAGAADQSTKQQSTTVIHLH